MVAGDLHHTRHNFTHIKQLLTGVPPPVHRCGCSKAAACATHPVTQQYARETGRQRPFSRACPHEQQERSAAAEGAHPTRCDHRRRILCPSTCFHISGLPCAGCTHSLNLCHGLHNHVLAGTRLGLFGGVLWCHIAGAKRSAPEAENGDEGDAQKKQRLQNGAAGMSEGEAQDAAMQSGSIESSRAMASGSMAEAEAAVKVC